jgi:hypothetical protein
MSGTPRTPVFEKTWVPKSIQTTTTEYTSNMTAEKAI